MAVLSPAQYEKTFPSPTTTWFEARINNFLNTTAKSSWRWLPCLSRPIKHEGALAPPLSRGAKCPISHFFAVHFSLLGMRSRNSWGHTDQQCFWVVFALINTKTCTAVRDVKWASGDVYEGKTVSSPSHFWTINFMWHPKRFFPGTMNC